MDFVWRWRTVCRECPAERLHLSWGFMTGLSVLSMIWYLAVTVLSVLFESGNATGSFEYWQFSSIPAIIGVILVFGMQMKKKEV